MKVMIKGLKVLAIFLALFIGVALIAPFLIDVDKYRPQLVEIANEKINGKLELGKLSLSLWGQVRVDVAGLQLKDSQGKDVLGVKEAYFHLPFLSLISGSPVINFKMIQPSVEVIKGKNGELNVLSLVKKSVPTPQSSQPTTPSAAPSEKEAAGPAKLPGIATRARLGIELKSASMVYRDVATGLSSEVKDLNVLVRDISFSHPMDLEVWAELDTRLGKTFLVQGLARMTGKVEPLLRDGKVQQVGVTAKVDMDSVSMVAPGLFEKKKGIATQAEISLIATEEEVRIEKAIAQFFNAELKLQGTVSLPSQKGADPSPVVKLVLNSNQIQFKPWAELIPMLKSFDLGGSAALEAELSGPPEKIGYKAKLVVKDFTANAPSLKAPPHIDAEVNMSTDQVESLVMTLKAPGNDLKVQGKVVSFSKPKMDFQVTSTGMDLDQWVNFPPPSQAKAKQTAEVKSGQDANSPASGAQPSQADFDAMLDPLRKNPTLAGLVASIDVQMKMIKAYGVKVSDIGCKLTFKDLAAGIEKCGFQVFSGKIMAEAGVQLKPAMPTYHFQTQVSGLEIKEAVESQFALFKNTLTGSAHFKMSGQGASFNPDTAMGRLKATGDLKVEKAAFATIDVAKMVSEALNKALGEVGDKIPAAKGKTVGNLPNRGSEYEFISSDFSIADGKFMAPHFFAKAMPNQGIDLKGATTVGLKDQSLDSKWDVIDTYNLTHAKDIAVEQNGVRVEHLLAEGDGPVHFPVSVNCKVAAPCYSYTEVPAFLIQVALKNMSAAVGSRAKQEVKKHAEELLKKAPPAIQNQVKDKLKGFFR